MSSVALVPARSGSKGVPNKNIIDLAGEPLLFYTVAACKQAGIDRVIVSTDSEEYAEVARHCGAEVPFLRPKILATDSSNDLEFILHALEWLLNNEGYEPEFVLHMRPTTPLREAWVIRAALEHMQETTWKSMRSAHLAPESPNKWFLRDGNGASIPFAQGVSMESLNMPRQKFEKVFIPNGYVDIVRSRTVLKERSIHTDSVFLFETPNTLEVDGMFDLEVIRAMAGSFSRNIIESLKGVKENGR